MPKLSILIAACLALMLTTAFITPAAPAAAPSLKDEMVAYDAHLDEVLRARDPGAADLFREANAARDANNEPRAVELYRKVLNRVPDFVPAIRRLGTSLAQVGLRHEAIALCRKALSAEDSRENEVALAAALATSSPTEKPAVPDLDEAKRLAQKALEKKPDDIYASITVCEVALARQDLELLSLGAARLKVVAPNELVTHYMNFVLLASTNQFEQARTALERARAAGLPEADYQKFSGLLVSGTPWTTRFWKPAAAVLVAWVVGAAILILLGWVLSRATLRAAAAMPPTPEGSAQGASLRTVYRAVLAACCAYYFVSLPLVLAAVVLGGGGAIYGLVMLGHIPIRLVVIIALVVLVTVFSAIRSLLIRVKDTDPGEKLDLVNEPALVATLQEVAARVGTRSVDNVYMIPGAGIAVMERGGLLKKLRGRTERCLIVGAAALEGMRLAPFKAVLAHEYGHFSNRDTAGGGLALAVRRSVIVMATQMARGGAATWYNPAWWFLRGFDRLFLFISQGASRLQEMLADRWAAFAYGSRAFEEGLRHVIARSVRFGAHVNATLDQAVKQGAALSNLYESEPKALPNESEIQDAIRAALERKPSPYDSHPSPTDRFRWVQALDAAGDAGGGSAGNEYAWGLFSDRRAIELLMTERVRLDLNASHGILLKAAVPQV